MNKRIALFGACVSLSLAIGCARLPYDTMAVEEQERLLVTLQQEVAPAGYAHPVQVTTADAAAILRGFPSVRSGLCPFGGMQKTIRRSPCSGRMRSASWRPR